MGEILKRWNVVDLGEMHFLAFQAKESGFEKVQIDTEHILDIILLAQAYVAEKQQQREAVKENKE